MNGFTMLQQLENKNFEVIFVTAYDHYAIKAIRYSALDYLVKPVEIDDLKNAINRVIEKMNIAKPNARLELLLENIISEKNKFTRIAIPTVQGLEFIKIDHIICLEASANYTKFHLCNNIKYTVSKTLKEFEDFSKTPRVTENDSFRIQSFVYIASAKINQHNMLGTFAEGVKLVPNLLEKLNLKPKEYYLATIHRPQNTDTPEALRLICDVLDEVAEKVKGADKLLHLSVDIGEAEPRSIVAGIALAGVEQEKPIVLTRIAIKTARMGLLG